MRTIPKKPINGLLVLLCILSMQAAWPRLLLAVGTMTLTASPTSVVADGSSASVITATVLDVVGQTSTPVPNLDLTFTTDRGFLTTPTKTDSAGKSVVTLTSQTPGTAIVTVRCPPCQPELVQTITVTFTAAPTPSPTPQPSPTPEPSVLSSVVLSVVNPTVPVGDPTLIPEITAQLFDQFNKTFAKPGVSVVFTTTPAEIASFSNNQATIIVSTDATGKASASLYSKAPGMATISATVKDGFVSKTANPVYVNFTGGVVSPPAFISLSASPYRIPADGSYTAITAVISDQEMQPVAAGTLVTFSTTLGVFQNGSTTYVVATPDDSPPNTTPVTVKGTVTVYLRAAATNAAGFAVITCTAGIATQSLTVEFVHMEYETEPNNEMALADGICFDYVYYSQLFSPYDEDWYTFTITSPSRIGINFITTATPADAGCESGTTTVGTWKVDIRNLDNSILMSRHNIDCIFDNGIWETGVIPPGTYNIVVYCPRLGSGDNYLSDFYYMSVFNNFYFPCGDRDKLVNAASLTQDASDYQLHVPIIDTTPYLWADLQYDPVPFTSQTFRLKNIGMVSNLDGLRSCNLSNLSLVGGNYVLHLPVVIYDGVSYRADLTYVPTTDGQVWFMLSGLWLN